MAWGVMTHYSDINGATPRSRTNNVIKLRKKFTYLYLIIKFDNRESFPEKQKKNHLSTKKTPFL